MKYQDFISRVPFEILTQYLDILEIILLSKLDAVSLAEINKKMSHRVIKIGSSLGEHFRSSLSRIPKIEIELSFLWDKMTDEMTRIPNLTSLNLSHQHSVSGISLPPSLRELNLSLNESIRDEILRRLPRLTSLNLSANMMITDEGLRHVPHLKDLDITRYNRITDVGLSRVPLLTRLVAYTNQTITDEGLRDLTQLTDLDISGRSRITNRGLNHVPHLRKLFLRNHESITDEGLLRLQELESLDLSANQVITLRSLRGLPRLKRIMIWRSSITPEDLRSTFPASVLGPTRYYDLMF